MSVAETTLDCIADWCSDGTQHFHFLAFALHTDYKVCQTFELSANAAGSLKVELVAGRLVNDL